MGKIVSRKYRSFIVILLIITMLCGINHPVHAAENVSRQTVRVGFFSADGYHQMDQDGTMKGYGYDFLQMLLRYNDWKYEYIGYDKNWGDMLEMLDHGEIDMVTLANKTPAREEKYAFSEKSIGTSSTIMSIRGGNTSIIPGEYRTYDGAIVGLVEGSSHNAYFEKYAEEKGFTYTPVYYEDISVLLQDLRDGKNIDIAVTSNMRVLENEIILDEFNASEYYVMMRKNDTELLQQVNSAISQLNVYSPDWRTKLFEKYYDNVHSEVIGLSIDERAYLKELKDSGQPIQAAMNPELRPYSYFENGEAKGIAPKLFQEIASRLGIDYVILPSKDRWEYKEQLSSGEADLDLTAYLDYSLAQKYNLKETDAYINSTLALLSRKDSNMNMDSMTIAVVKDPTEYIGYNQLIAQYKQKEYNSIQECIDAVRNGEVDATFRYAYIAEQAVQRDYTRKLQYSVLPDYYFSMAIGVNNEDDHRLLSILNKGVNSLTTTYAQGVMLEESSHIQLEKSLVSVVYDYPVVAFFMIALIGTIIFILAYISVKNHAQKEKELASKEMQRFIAYMCESYETIAEINLESKKRIIYEIRDGAFTTTIKEHKTFDAEYFKKLVKPDDLDEMLSHFSEEKIDTMLAAGGGEDYFEIQIRDRDPKDHDRLLDSYSWYSYIVRAVPVDIWHPRNFVMFEKNIQESKMGEEEQKQLLRDALENANNASAAKGQFLSRMSHEIRTPLNAVIGYMEIARDAKDNPDKMLHCVENSDLAAKHLLSIINDVLDISSIESGRMKIAHEEFDLKQQLLTLSTIFYHQAADRKVRFEVVLNQFTEEHVVGDTLRLNQILMNLLSNAVKFTPEGGLVSLTATQVKTDEKNVFMKFVVSDNGIGMSEEYKKRLFQPFEQESASTAQKYGGTGLGLSITSNLIQLMGGSIEVETKQNEGTTFVVSLHFGRGESQQEWKEFADVRALVLDNHKQSANELKALLKVFGIKSDVVTDGETAAKRILGRVGTEYAYGLCMMNCNMEGLDIVTATQHIIDLCKEDTPKIVAFAYDITEYEEQMKAIGVSKLISKPVFTSTIADLLDELYRTNTQQKEKQEEKIDIRGLHVLLAEDNPMNLEIAIEILQKAGLIVDSVSDGKQAYEKFTEEPQGTYQAILMDVQMPVMDGYQATGAIRKSGHPEALTIPIIAMTANAFAEDVNAALASGMNGHISKPVNYDKLYKVLHQFCKE